MFDSLYSSVPEMAKAQIACLVCTKESNIEVRIRDVQMQVYSLYTRKMLCIVGEPELAWTQFSKDSQC